MEVQPESEHPVPKRQKLVPKGKRSKPSIGKAEIRRLIRSAARGDEEATRLLLVPFIGPEEKVLQCGLAAKFGIFATYDFFFLTDRRIGDLEITPFTGNLNVEVAYLQKVDAYVINQPAIPILLRLLMAILYLYLIGFLINPVLKRAFLRLKKSGLWCKLTGSPVGVLIFADRDNFNLLTKLTREMDLVKRQLDKQAM